MDAKEAEKLKELLEQAEGHPMTKTIWAEEAAKVLKERQEASAKIWQLIEKAEMIIPSLLAKLGEVEVELKRQEAKRKVILDTLRKAWVSLAKAKGDLEREKGQAEEILFLTYDEKIDQAILFFRDHLDVLRLIKPDKHTHKNGTNIFTWTNKLTTYSNIASINLGLTYIRMAIQELEGTKLEPVLDLKKIETLKREIPDVAALTEFSKEKPLERMPDPLAMPDRLGTPPF